MRKNYPFLFLIVAIVFGIGWLFTTNSLLQRIMMLVSNSSVTANSGLSAANATPESIQHIQTSIPRLTPKPQVGPWSNWQAPDFSLATLAGKTEQLSSYRGQVVLLNFWTSWCIPCKEEMPAIQSIYETYHDQGFMVLGINITELDERVEAERFVEELDLTFPILRDEDGYVSDRVYRVISIPTSFFVDKNGKIYSIQVGAVPREKIEQLVREQLFD